MHEISSPEIEYDVGTGASCTVSGVRPSETARAQHIFSSQKEQVAKQQSDKPDKKDDDPTKMRSIWGSNPGLGKLKCMRLSKSHVLTATLINRCGNSTAP
jgi:hypothetical protein